MNRIQIIIIIVVAVIGAILVSTYTTAVDSTTFSEARSNAGKKVKIVGSFDKTKGLQYDALKDANLTVFNVIDKDGYSECVNLHYKQGKPMGLEQSENVTIHGQYAADGTFVADDIQMKCPSKYNDQKHELATQ